MNPNYFFIIGAMKAGTTSLYKYLRDHPELYASPRKEPRVFRDPQDPARLKAAFAGLFTGRRDERWCFEGSTAYTKYPAVDGVPERIRSIAPDARFVYLVRDPVDRAWSHYVHNLAHGRETRRFERAVKESPEYLTIGRYHLQLTQFLRVFPRERILIQVFEEMVQDPLVTVRSVCEFLGVDASYTPSSRGVAFNASGDKVAAPPSVRVMRRLGLDDYVPWRIRRALKLRGAALPSKATGLPEDVRHNVIASLHEDTEAFLKILGRRLAVWPNFR